MHKAQRRVVKKHPQLFVPPSNNDELQKFSPDNTSKKQKLSRISSASFSKQRLNSKGTLSNKYIGFGGDRQTFEDDLGFIKHNTNKTIDHIKKSRLQSAKTAYSYNRDRSLNMNQFINSTILDMQLERVSSKAGVHNEISSYHNIYKGL
jgi:hypothetical protein